MKLRDFCFSQLNAIFLPSSPHATILHWQEEKIWDKAFQGMKTGGENTKFKALTLWAALKDAEGEAGWAALQDPLGLSGPWSPYLQPQWTQWSHFQDKVPRTAFQMVTHLIECKPLSQRVDDWLFRWGFVFYPIPNKTLKRLKLCWEAVENWQLAFPYSKKKKRQFSMKTLLIQGISATSCAFL